MSFHLYDIKEIFSNEDGTVQFIELAVGNSSGENHWGGQHITVTQGSTVHTYTFTGDLPSSATNNTSVLIATQAFADMHLVTPDYIVPAGFLFTTGDTVAIDFAASDAVTYNPLVLPDDGFHSLVRSGTNTSMTLVALAHPQNFAGQQADMPIHVVNTINGTEGDDRLVGTALDDQVNGLGGDDTLDGASGNDTLAGGAGTDTVELGVPLSGVQSYSASNGQIEGTTTREHVVLTGIERVKFTDSYFALDTNVGQNVWEADALLWAAFGHAPSMGLLSQWTAQADNVTTMSALAQAMLNFYAPGGVSNQELITYLYGMVQGRAPTATELQEIGPGKTYATQADFAVHEATLAANTDRMAGFTGTVQQLDPSWF